MSFVAAKCPQCGGDLQLDPEKEMGFCMHCGSKIVVQEAVRAVRIDNTHMIDAWMKMGVTAAEAGNNKEAYEYFTKVVENDSNNWQAVFQKGKAAGWQSTYGKSRMAEFFQGVAIAQKMILQLNIPLNKKNEAWKSFALETINLTQAYANIAQDILKEDTRTSQEEYVRLAYQAIIECIEFMEVGLGLLDGMDDDEARSLRLQILKSIYYLCKLVCIQQPMIATIDSEIKMTLYWGVPLEFKQRFITRYDEVSDEIRKVEPQFEKNDLVVIDRLEPSTNWGTKYCAERNAENRSLQERINREKEINNKKKHWEDHPVEYETFLEEEKRRKDEIDKHNNNLKTVIDSKSAQIRELDLELSNLKLEHGKLGIFAGNQKKTISEKINLKELECMKLRNEINKLNSGFLNYGNEHLI